MEEKSIPCYCSAEDGIVCEYHKALERSKYHFPKRIEHFNADMIRAKTKEKIEELEANMIVYGGKVHYKTIIGGANGKYTSHKFLEWLGYNNEDITRMDEDGWVYEETYKAMAQFQEDLNVYCQVKGIDLGEYQFIVEFCDSDGDIDVTLEYKHYEDSIEGISEEEYAIRLALKEAFRVSLTEIIDLDDEGKHQIAGKEYLVVHEDDTEEVDLPQYTRMSLDVDGELYYAYLIE